MSCRKGWASFFFFPCEDGYGIRRVTLHSNILSIDAHRYSPNSYQMNPPNYNITR